MLILAIIAFTFGHYRYIGKPFDPDRRPCGLEVAKEYPYLYFTTPLVHADVNYNYRTVCVKSCPPTEIKDFSKYNLECLPNSLVPDCTEKRFPPYNTTVWYYETINFHKTVCLPQSHPLYTAVGDNIWPDYITQRFRDLASCMSWILSSILIGAILSLMGICLLLITSFCYYKGFKPIKEMFLLSKFIPQLLLSPPTQIEINLQALRDSAAERTNSSTFFQVIAIILTLIFIFFIHYIITKTRLINLAIHAMEVRKFTIQNFMAKYYHLLRLSFFAVIFMGIYLIFWVYVLMYLFACGSLKSKNEKSMPFEVFEQNKILQTFMIFHFISLLWSISLLINFIDFLASSMMGFYYFSEGDANVYDCFKQSFQFSLWQLGTIIKGSCLLVVFALPRTILKLSYDYIEENPTKIITKCLNILTICFQPLYNLYLIGINNNGYCLSALYGDSFIESGKKAEMISTYPKFEDRFDMVSDVGQMFIYVARFCITVTIGVITFLTLTLIPYYNDNLFQIKFPAIIIMLCVFVCSACIIDMYNSLTDAFLICYFLGEASNEAFKQVKDLNIKQIYSFEVHCKDQTFKTTLDIINEKMKDDNKQEGKIEPF